MKDSKLSRRTFVRMSTAGVAAMSLPAMVSARSVSSTEAPASAPQQQGGASQNIIPAWRPGDADSFTRYYFDSLMLEARYLDSDTPSTKLELFGETFDTPIMTAALSHLNNPQNGMLIYAQAAAACKAVHWMGMGEDKELEDIIATGARTIKIIKPHADNNEVFRRIRHAVGAGCLAVGMDIDHSFNTTGGYDVVLGLPMKPKTTDEIKSFVKASGVPFIIKGVLSVSDARKCLEAGVAGIVISHHGGHVPYSVPPLMVLEEIADVVKGRMKIFVDCGVVSGMDAYKCLALGADAVSVGRHLMPFLSDGADATARRIKAMTAELARAMAVTGVTSLGKMDPSVIHRTLF